MKYGDIVVYKNQIGTVVKSENDFKFHMDVVIFVS